jgi:DNA polymerase-1
MSETPETPQPVHPGSPDTPKEELPRLFLIDGYSNIFRAFYAIRNLSNSRGEPTNAVFGFVNMLRKLLRDEQPELVGVALDVSSQTVRSEQYEEYKANRSPMPDDLRSQIPWIRQAIEAYRIPIREKERYEADDVLGTLAAKASAAGYHVILVSADKDLMQLVGPRVSLMHTGRDKLYDPALVEEDFGVPPHQVVDVLALMGDASDNVPGVPGIGAKGAQTLIQEYGSVEALLDAAPTVKRKSYREGLLEHRESALQSKELVTIHCDLDDVDFDREEFRHDPPDHEALVELFGDLGFHSLVDELERDQAASEELPQARELETAQALRSAVGAIPAEVPVRLVLLGSEAPTGLAVSWGDSDHGEPVYGDLRRDGLREAISETLEGWLCDDSRQVVGHDLKEILRLVPGGPGCRARLFDTMLASYLIRPSSHAHGFEEVVLERMGRKVLTEKEAGWEKSSAPPVGDERIGVYAGERLELLDRLASSVQRELAEVEEGALQRVYSRIEAPLLPVLLGMEERGVLLDCEFLAAMSRELGDEIETLEGKIYQVAGEEFNVNSPSQLGVIMFEKLDYPVLKRTKKTRSPATGADVLEELARRGYELPDLILRYRELSKLKSTYVDALPTMVADDGRIHTRFNQAVAATGRLSSANPNLQNIPIRTELGQRIRKAFVAAPGHLLLAADYSQVELRLLAHIAQETALIEAFNAGEDIHRTTAATVLGVAPELVTDEQRRAAKTINFGIMYGMSPFGLANTLNISRKEAENFIDTYLERYAGVKRYMDETLEFAESQGKVTTLYGRVRYLPEITSRNRALKENARRMAINARIQGTAADLMKLAMIQLEERLAAELPEARLLLTVHDELVLEVPEGRIEDAAALTREVMSQVADLAVPLVVDAGWGESWYDAK